MSNESVDVTETTFCHACQKIGHLARRCRSKGKASQQTNALSLAEEEGDKAPAQPQPQDTGEQEYQIYKLNMMQRGPRSDPIVVKVSLNGPVSEIEVDTGAAVTVIHEGLYTHVGAPALQASNCILRTYTGERVDVLGQVAMLVQHESQKR